MPDTPKLILEFITEDEASRQLASDYWSGEYASGKWIWHRTGKEIAEQYGIKPAYLASASRLAAIAKDQAVICAGCASERQLETRTDFTSWKGDRYRCRKCILLEREERLPQHQEGERRLLAEKLSVITKLSERLAPCDYSTVSYIDAIVLYSIFVASDHACESGEFGGAFNLHLCPSNDLASRLLTGLYERGLLFISPNSPPNAIEKNDEGKWSYDSLMLRWRIAPDADGRSYTQLMSFLGEVVDLGEDHSEYVESIDELWWMLATDDAKVYLQEQVYEFRLPDYKFGPKTEEAIKHALETYSIPLVRRCISSVVKNAAALSVNRSYDRYRAKNTIPGSLISFVDRALSNNWEVFPRLRNWTEDEPILLTMLFDRVLKTGGSGFKSLHGSALRNLKLQGYF